MAKKIAIVTALIGAYDSKLPQFIYDKDKYDVICYTNIKGLKSNTWDMIHVDELMVEGDNAKSSYYYKWNPHKYLDHDKYDIMVWVDCSFTKFNIYELQKFIDTLKSSDKSIYIEKHPSRNTLKDELNANIALKKDIESRMVTQVDNYFNEGYDDNDTIMVETGLSIRKFKDIKLINFSHMVWSEILPENNTKRDQLVFDYCVWKSSFKDNILLFTFKEKCDVVLFQDHPNRASHKPKYLMVGPWLGDSSYEIEWVRYVRDYIESRPVDKVIVGCRPGRERLYGDIVDKFIISDPDGVVDGNLLDEKVPKFDIKSDNDKEIIRLSPTTSTFRIVKSRYDDKLVVSLADRNFKDGCTIGNGDLTEYDGMSKLYWDRSDNIQHIHVDTDIEIGRSGIRGDINVALLVEPEEFDRLYGLNSYANTKIVEKYYDYILTYDGKMLEGDLSDKTRFYPYGGCWIKPNDYKVYDKTKSLSMISSTKNITTGHKLRLSIMDECKDLISDMYGRDTNPIDYKLEALKDYKFSIVVESSKKNYYFTEKIIDCFMTGTIPIYWGCPAIADYFNIDGILTFDTIDELKDILELDLDKEYEKRKDSIVKNFNTAKNFTVIENNIYNVLEKL